ncbi:thiol reductant ABC exporter subunit CydC [Herminiimonas fonticola]|uniref:ATP-binding cassette subfamily C protein CydC n=1 Tax=Herminiimonas fonticola TaxID=303380 RepID=A0A4R6G6T5_9BURK|nr:thiol reductant ABC exporter subunit CydC [Herminiimonas fonticola]RBA24216.1 CydC: thiol reductant ABC exporter, CydC subunit [Herminiimonas fonticola]TDN90217.1 ATP-binding cassette subfamily C protein CydC [Herminiimonas fonticola]
MKLSRDLHPVLALFFASDKNKLLTGALLAAVTVLSGMALLGLSGWFITATAIAGLNVSLAFMFDVFMPSAGIRLLALGRTAARYGERLVTHDATLAVLAALRERLFLGWAQPEAARRLMVRPAQLLFRLTGDIDALDSLYLRILVPLASALVAALATGIALSFIDVYLGISIAIWLIATGLGIAYLVARGARRAARHRSYGIEALRARSIDLVAGQTELLMAGRLTAQKAALRAADEYLARADDTLNQLEARAGAAYSVVGSLTLVATLLVVAVLMENGVIGAPVAALALLLVLTATEPFSALRRGALELGRTVLAARRLNPRLQDADSPTVKQASVLFLSEDLILSLHDVRAHPAGQDASDTSVLQDISLKVARNERVALIGASGAGKSTLMAVIAGELAAQSGTVQVAAHSLLTQRTELFQDSLRDNLRLADATANDARLWDVLQTAGLADDVAKMPNGLDTRLGEGGLGLSGGQLRRLALARLLLRDVPLWLLDEPTEGLDPQTARDVLQRLDKLAAGRSLLLATHVRREAALANRLVCMEHGRIVMDVMRGDTGFDLVLNTLRPD